MYYPVIKELLELNEKGETCRRPSKRNPPFDPEGSPKTFGQFEKPPHPGRFVIHLCGDLREAGDAGTGRVLGH